MFLSDSIIFCAAVTTAAIFSIYIYLLWKSNYWIRKGVNGPKAYPLIGTLWENATLAVNLLEKQRLERYGRVYGAMQGLKPILTVADPDLIKQIRIADFKYTMNHRAKFPGHPFLSKLLSELKDEEWKRVRSIINPVFSTGKLKAMLPLINQCIKNTFEYFETMSKEEKEVDLKKVMMSYTMDTISATAFSMKTNGYKDPNNEFLSKANDLMTYRLWRLIASLILPSKVQLYFNLGLFPQNLVNYFKNVLKTVIQERKVKKFQSNDFVHLLLNSEISIENANNSTLNCDISKKLTDDEIIAQCFTFFLVGYETTSTLLQFTLYALAMNPQVQDKLLIEIRNCYARSKEFEYDDLMSLAYFDAVINESLRMYSPVPIFEHVCGADYTLNDTGITIEKGTIINTSYYAMHHDKELFPEPNVFKPERFLPENRNAIKPYSFLPFGTGPRICIGMRYATFNAKLFLANLINQFEVVRSENTASEPIFDGAFILLTCKPLLVKFQKRWS